MTKEQEQLLFKALCMYLPYGVEFLPKKDMPQIEEILEEFTPDQVWNEQTGTELAKSVITQIKPFICCELDDNGKDIIFLGQCENGMGYDIEDVFIDQVNLILHPLSKLTEEIEHNGEKFVPMDRLNLDYSHPLLHTKISVSQDALFTLQISVNGSGRYALPFAAYEKLLEWHIDIYGLIDQGLAKEKP